MVLRNIKVWTLFIYNGFIKVMESKQEKGFRNSLFTDIYYILHIT